MSHMPGYSNHSLCCSTLSAQILLLLSSNTMCCCPIIQVFEVQRASSCYATPWWCLHGVTVTAREGKTKSQSQGALGLLTELAYKTLPEIVVVFFFFNFIWFLPYYLHLIGKKEKKSNFFIASLTRLSGMYSFSCSKISTSHCYQLFEGSNLQVMCCIQ